MSSRSPAAWRFPAWDEAGVIRLENRSGLRFSLLPNGAIGSIEHDGMLINQSRGILPEGAPFRLWLRSGRESVALLNPAHVTAFGPAGPRRAVWQGRRAAWRWQVRLELDAARPAWTWQVTLEHPGPKARPAEVVLAQDLALAGLKAARTNENYTAHYIDHAPLEHPEWGPVLCARQNLPQDGGRHPWLALACPTGAAAYATDGVDVVGLSQRVTGRPLVEQGAPLPSRRRQGESACAALQSRPVLPDGNQPAEVRFRLVYQPHHPAATSPDDLTRLHPGTPSAGRPPPAAPVPRSCWDDPRLQPVCPSNAKG